MIYLTAAQCYPTHFTNASSFKIYSYNNYTCEHTQRNFYYEYVSCIDTRNLSMGMQEISHKNTPHITAN